MNYTKITKNETDKGRGTRVVLWVSGNDVYTPKDFEQDEQDFNAGNPFDTTAEKELYTALSQHDVTGLTLSGGNPLAKPNLLTMCRVIDAVRELCPDKDIWLYTGYELTDEDFEIPATMEEVSDSFNALRGYVVRNCDVIVDGPFIESKKDITLKFRGSSNQRIIDVKKTMENKSITEYEL